MDTKDIAEKLKTKERVIVRGFGTFKARTLPERWAVNPANGEPVLVKERKKVFFKASKRLHAMVNGK